MKFESWVIYMFNLKVGPPPPGRVKSQVGLILLYGYFISLVSCRPYERNYMIEWLGLRGCLFLVAWIFNRWSSLWSSTPFAQDFSNSKPQRMQSTPLKLIDLKCIKEDLVIGISLGKVLFFTIGIKDEDGIICMVIILIPTWALLTWDYSTIRITPLLCTISFISPHGFCAHWFPPCEVMTQKLFLLSFRS